MTVRRKYRWAFGIVAGLWLPCVAFGAAPADLVVTGGRIYTAPGKPLAEALAARGGRIVYVGTNDGARALVGPRTRREDAGGRLVIPGLADTHIHPLDIVDLDVCDLDSRPMPLKALAEFVAGCLKKYRTPPGKRLVVHEWNYTGGNQPDAERPTLRAALDQVSTTVEIELLGNDAHHAAFNSLGLSHARNAQGAVVGISKATLATDFAAYSKLIGVDAQGEPNGAVNEDARYTINPHSMLYTELEATLKVAERIPERLNSVGITAMLDAMAAPDGQPVYDRLLARHRLTVRTTLAQFYDPARFRRADGDIDWAAMVAQAEASRAKYAGNPLIAADTVKLFADGVLEGNPYAVPPTLPNGALLEPLLQPIFGTDASGRATVLGYVDTASETCLAVRSEPERFRTRDAIDAFTRAHGFHPGQCQISRGQLQHERAVILEFARRFHLAGFNLHIHVLGDRAARTAIDAIEAARAADGNSSTRDALAHLQLVHPDDLKRIGRDKLFVAFTYAWAEADPEYDLTVIPFIQKVSGNSYESLHAPGSYYESNAYPFRGARDAGAILTAGSDAPVETRDPRPFVNMARALTRHLPGEPALNAGQTLTIEDVLAAYTINGARLLGRDRDIGTLEAGKSADFVELDRDILALAGSQRFEEIAGTRVLGTWFQGRRVYRAAVTP
ncbi:MAG TPA: amidohydrolase family protein [Steroidobacteraceae bacterium]|nr:amidohydrolase family protein [Steroidobacteraceae bacterium]